MDENVDADGNMSCPNLQIKANINVDIDIGKSLWKLHDF